MVMGGDQAGIDHASRGVDPLLARQRIELADLGNSPVCNADGALGAHRGAGKPGEDSLSARDQGRSHASAPTSLSCHPPSASLERPTMSVNKATPASVMSSMAANIRGISRANPACR